MRVSSRSFSGVFLAAIALAAGSSWAGDFASEVISYTSGATYPPPDPNDFSFVPPAGQVNANLTSASGALGALTADTSFGVLTPYNAVFATTDYVGIGQGGSLTLKMATPIRTDGFTLGVHTGVGLIDFDYPNGSTSGGAFPYTTDRNATVDVSADNNTWVTLGSQAFDIPSNYFATGVATPGYQPTDPAGAPADESKPFTGSLADFGGKDWAGVQTLLDGSAGGTWFDLSSTGLSEVNYVRFSVDTGDVMYVDAVSGVPTPEPATLGTLGAAAMLLLLRRRR